MPLRTFPWSRLGLPAGWSGTQPSLRRLFGAAWPPFAHYFLPSQELALSIDCPSPGGPGCPRQVIEHGFDDLIAVCGNSPHECESIPLARKDVIIHVLAIDRLLADLNRMLGIKGAATPEQGGLTWNLGDYVAAGRATVSVFLCLEGDPGELRLTLCSLLNRQGAKFVLLLPCRDDCPASLLRALQSGGASVVDLDDMADGEPAHFLARYAPEVCSGEEPGHWWRLEDDYWRIRFQGKIYSVRQSKGMQYIAHLIQRAYNNQDNPEIHSLALYYKVNPQPPGANLANLGAIDEQGQLAGETGLRIADLGGGLYLSTPEAKERLRQEIKYLGQQLAEANERGDHDEALRLREQMEAIAEHCIKNGNKNGRVRQVGGTNERARQAVESAIRYTLASKKIDKKLADYLRQHTSPGSFCSFKKDDNLAWQIFM